jgi:hypothetical protein
VSRRLLLKSRGDMIVAAIAVIPGVCNIRAKDEGSYTFTVANGVKLHVPGWHECHKQFIYRRACGPISGARLRLHTIAV